MTKTIITGRLTADVEMKQTQGGKSVASFFVAVDRPGKSGPDKQADFYRCTVWEKSADFCAKWLRKGARVIVSGHMECRKWTDKEGAKRESWELHPDLYGGVEPIDWSEKGDTLEEQRGGDDNFFDDTGFSPSPVDPNIPGF